MSPRRSLPSSPLRQPQRLTRVFLDRAFAVLALAATLFGLLVLLVFFIRLGLDVTAWFRTMPALVERHNQALAAQAQAAQQARRMADEALAQIDREMEAELRTAATEQEKAQIRADFVEIKAQRLADLGITTQELLQDARGIREDTRPVALLAHFFTAGPSHEPQNAGIEPALLGSLYLALVVVLTAVPVGVGAAIYLEEYRSNNWLARVIQVNINNLAGVPSVMYGILGAFVFVELIFKQLESEHIAARNLLGGGLTLGLLTLPVIIVSAQEAIRAVPGSLRHGAFALGATRWQVIWHVVLPSAIPGTMTGIILAVCRALGEAAPLVLFGALLFVNHNPGLFSRFTALPLQIFGWSDRPASAWQYNAALASAVLVVTLLGLNAAAIYLRQRAQRHIKW